MLGTIPPASMRAIVDGESLAALASSRWLMSARRRTLRNNPATVSAVIWAGGGGGGGTEFGAPPSKWPSSEPRSGRIMRLSLGSLRNLDHCPMLGGG
jgi:hypothetical protein